MIDSTSVSSRTLSRQASASGRVALGRVALGSAAQSDHWIDRSLELNQKRAVIGLIKLYMDVHGSGSRIGGEASEEELSGL